MNCERAQNQSVLASPGACHQIAVQQEATRTPSALTFSEALASLEPEALKAMAASVPSWAAMVPTVFCQ